MKKLCAVPLIILSAVSCRAAVSDQEKLNAYIQARGFYAAEVSSGKVIAMKRSSSSVPVASTTKMVTALTARSLVKGNPVVTITRESAKLGGAKAGLADGERYYFNDLLCAMLVRSANDAASAVAVAASGSREAFVSEMNRWCREHKLTASHFADPSGLSPQSVSSPEELAFIAKEFLSSAEFDRIASLDEYTLRSASGRTIPLKSLNVLHRVMPEDEFSVRGKTGFIAKSKYCFAGKVVTKKGSWYVAVTGADNSWRQTYQLIKYCEGELELPR